MPASASATASGKSSVLSRAPMPCCITTAARCAPGPTGATPSAGTRAPRWHALARGDFALRGTARAMTAPERRGGLTAKFAIGGREWYRTDGQATCADEDGWLVLAEGERYASRIAADRPVTTLALFFAPATIAAARAARGSDVDLLDDPLARASDEPVGGGCRRLAFAPELARAVADADDVAGVCELHALALDRILEAAARAAGERARLAAVRPSTRAVSTRYASFHETA